MSLYGRILGGLYGLAVGDSWGMLALLNPDHSDVAMSAAAVAEALRPGAALDDLVAAGMQGAELGRRLGPLWLGASVARRIALAVELARRSGDPRARLRDLYDLIGSTLAASEAVPAAFGVLVMGEGDPVRTAMHAANLSGDADTVGAMACCIAGAWRGVEAFPPEVLRQIDEANPELVLPRWAEELARLAAVGGGKA